MKVIGVLTAFLTTLEQMIRILLFLAIGFALNRLHILPKGAGAGCSKLVTVLFIPALQIYTNMTQFRMANLVNYGQLILLGGLFWAIAPLLSFYVAKKLGNGNHFERGIYLYGLSFSNTGGVGTPLILALFGSAGLFEYNLAGFFIVIMTYAWGMGLFMDKEQKRSLKSVFTHIFNPIFIAILIGLALGALGAQSWMPVIVVDVLGDLSSCYVPVSLILSGYTIADYPLRELFTRPKDYVYVLMRLVVIPLCAVAIAWFAGLSAYTATLILLLLACPSGMNVVIFPAARGQDCRTGASIVLLSHLASILTIPILYALVQHFFG